jgi:hypothetical protein
MREMQIMAGVVSLVVACVLAVELVLGSAGADQRLAGALAGCFLVLGILAIWDAVRFEEKSWVEDLTLAHLKAIHKRK